MRRTLTLTTAAALLALAGCTSTTAKTTSSNAAPAPATTSARHTTTAAPSPTAKPPMTLGASWAWRQEDGTTSGATTTISYRQHVATDGPTPQDAFGASSRGYVWAALDVKVCNNAGSSKPAPVSDTDWTLTYADGTQIKVSGTGYDNFPKPAFPMGDTGVQPGRCLVGNIVFPVPGKSRPALIDYAPGGMDVPVEWAAPAK